MKKSVNKTETDNAKTDDGHIYIDFGVFSSVNDYNVCPLEGHTEKPVLSFRLRTDVGYQEEMAFISLYMEHVDGTAYKEENIEFPMCLRLYEAEMSLNKAVLIKLTDINIDKVPYDDLIKYGVIKTVYDNINRDICGNAYEAYKFVYSSDRAILEISSEIKTVGDYLLKNVSDESFKELSNQLSGLKSINVNTGEITREDVEKVLPKRVKKKKLN